MTTSIAGGHIYSKPIRKGFIIFFLFLFLQCPYQILQMAFLLLNIQINDGRLNPAYILYLVMDPI